jgi:hypothetical protein
MIQFNSIPSGKLGGHVEKAIATYPQYGGVAARRTFPGRTITPDGRTLSKQT